VKEIYVTVELPSVEHKDLKLTIEKTWQLKKKRRKRARVRKMDITM
jgi:HSP20 family molecular chaperone IbpA